MLRRTGRIRIRSTLRRGEPTPAEKAEARLNCYDRAGGMCELRCSPLCKVGPLPFYGEVLHRFHLSHKRNKNTYGWQESEATGQVHRCACAACHGYEHAGKKPVPKGDWRDIM